MMGMDVIPGPNPFIIDDETEPPASPSPPRLTVDVPGVSSEPEYSRRGSTTALPQHTSDQEPPVISIPGLTDPSLFLPIPTTDPLSTLLAKYVPNPLDRPPRDISGDWHNEDFHALVMTNSWRALARMARDKIVNTPTDDLNLVLGLWYIRLNCLARMRLYNQTSAECTSLFSLLNKVEPLEAKEHLFEHILPFELEVFRTRLYYWDNDPYEYLNRVSLVLKKCKDRSRKSFGQPVGTIWSERAARVSLILASQLMEMKQFPSALDLLLPLCDKGSPELRSAAAHICLQAGHLHLASRIFLMVKDDPSASFALKSMNSSMQAMASGDWDQATAILETILQKQPENVTASNNLAAALLNRGHVMRGIDVLEKTLQLAPSSVLSAEPVLFNLSTLYELRSATALERKVMLLVETAKWSGDGLKASALKLN